MNLALRRINIEKGINLNLVHEDKFDINLLSIYFVLSLDRKDVTKNALLPLVLERYARSSIVQKKLEKTHNSNVGIRIIKEGEKQIISFTAKGPRFNKLQDKMVMMELIDILKSLICTPYSTDDIFSQQFVSREKENLKKIIEDRRINKEIYVKERCIEEMYRNEKFSIHPLGYIEDLDKIDNVTLYKHYKEILDKAMIEIFYIGDLDDHLVEYIIDSFKYKRDSVMELSRESVTGNVQIKNMVYEHLDLDPGWLVIGYRSGIPYEDILYNGLEVGSYILGGGPNSKLFKMVREKDIAHNMNCKLYKHKSLMLINGRVNSEDFQKIIAGIRTEIDNLKKGSFTKEDMNISKQSIKASIKSMYEDKLLFSDFLLGRILIEDGRSLDETLMEIDRVSKDEIVEASKSIKADTIYFHGKPI